ncbi:hypothetical protein YC2023_031611 [Brassica napus]
MGYLINLRLNKLQTAKVKAQKIIENAPQVRISLKGIGRPKRVEESSRSVSTSSRLPFLSRYRRRLGEQRCVSALTSKTSPPLSIESFSSDSKLLIRFNGFSSDTKLLLRFIGSPLIHSFSSDSHQNQICKHVSCNADGLMRTKPIRIRFIRTP